MFNPLRVQAEAASARAAFIASLNEDRRKNKAAHTEWRHSVGLKPYFPPPPPPPLPDPCAMACWVLGLPILNVLWALSCEYTKLTSAIAGLMTLLLVLAYLMTPLPTGKGSDLDVQAAAAPDALDASVPTDGSSSVGSCWGGFKVTLSFALQLGMGAAAYANLHAMVLDPPATVPAGASVVLLSAVGIIDVLAVLCLVTGTWLGLRALEVAGGWLSDGFRIVNENAKGANEGLRNEMMRLIEWSVEHEAEMSRRSQARPARVALVRSLLLVKAESPEAATETFGETFGERLRRHLVEYLSRLSTPIEWFNALGYVTRQSPIKMGVTILDMYSLVNLLHFLFDRWINSEHPRDWFSPAVQASVASALLTFIVMSDSVRQYTRPEEFLRGAREEEERAQRRQRRTELEAKLIELMVPPINTTALEIALKAVEDGGNDLTRRLYERAKVVLADAQLRDRLSEERRQRALDALRPHIKRDPWLVDDDALEASIEEAISAGVNSPLLEQAETTLLAARLLRKRQLDALRRLLQATGEMDPDTPNRGAAPSLLVWTTKKSLLSVSSSAATPLAAKSIGAHGSRHEEEAAPLSLEEASRALVRRASPAVRMAHKAVLGLQSFKKRPSSSEGAPAHSEYTPAQRIDTEELASAIDHARSWRLPKEVMEAVKQLLLDAQSAQAGMSQLSTTFALTLRRRAADTRKHAAVLCRLHDARTAVSESLANLRSTCHGAVMVGGALDELDEALSVAKRARLDDPLLIAQAAQEYVEGRALLGKRDVAVDSLERAHEFGGERLEWPQVASQNDIAKAAAELAQAITNADSVYVSVPQSHAAAQQRLMALHAERAVAMARVTALIKELDRAQDAVVGAEGRPVPQLREAIAAASHAKVQATFADDAMRTLELVRLPRARLIVASKACGHVHGLYVSGARGRIKLDAETSSEEAVDEAVADAMAELASATEKLRTALDGVASAAATLVELGHAADAEKLMNEDLQRNLPDESLLETALETLIKFTAALTVLEHGKLAVRPLLTADGSAALGKRDQVRDASAMLKDAILSAQQGRLPEPLIHDARQLARPLYGLTSDGIGMDDQAAPVLTSHRQAILKETRPRKSNRTGAVGPRTPGRTGRSTPPGRGGASMH